MYITLQVALIVVNYFTLRSIILCIGYGRRLTGLNDWGPTPKRLGPTPSKLLRLEPSDFLSHRV